MSNVANSAIEEVILGTLAERRYTHEEVVKIVERALQGKDRAEVVLITPDEAAKNFSVRLETFRAKKRLSYQDLSDEIQRVTGKRISKSTLYRVGTGVQIPKLDEIQAISVFLSVPIEDMILPLETPQTLL